MPLYTKEIKTLDQYDEYADTIDQMQLDFKSDMMGYVPKVILVFYKLFQSKEIRPREAFINEVLNNPVVQLYLIFEYTTPIGFIQVMAELTSRTLMIQNYYIRPQSRGKGKGTSIMNQLFKIAKKIGIKSVMLNSLYKNTKADKFYRKYGFIPFTTSFYKET